MIIKWPRHIRRLCTCDRSSPYCAGCELFTCATCGASEGELTTDCVGHSLHPTIRQSVLLGVMDYSRKDGWKRLADGQRLSSRGELT